MGSEREREREREIARESFNRKNERKMGWVQRETERERERELYQVNERTRAGC